MATGDVRSGSLGGALAPWTGRLRAIDDLGARAAPVAVACSGGADSLALLALVVARGLPAIAVHVDHGLRAGSAVEADTVAAAADDLGVAFESRRVTVGRGRDLEARARAARFAALEAARAEHGAAAVLLGHTADDQAETVLLHVLRGAATAGLAGMPDRRDPWRRPILGLRRSDTAEVCARLGVAPLVDPMNADERFRRVWLRREVLPALERGAHRDLRAVLARQADVLRAESELLDGLADALLDPDGPGGRGPAVERLATAPVALARRAVRRWLGPPPPSLDDVDAVLGVAAGRHPGATLAGGTRVERAGGHLHRVGARGAGPADAPAAVRWPGRVEGAGIVLDTWIEQAAPVRWPDGRSACVVDADRAGTEARLRTVRSGDRIRPLGLAGSKSVGRALAEAGVPAGARRRVPVVVAGTGAAVPPGEPLWVVGYRVDDRARVTASTRRYLWIAASDGGAAGGTGGRPDGRPTEAAER